MPPYLLQVAYTSEVWANALKNPGDRIAALSKSVEDLGGTVVGGWMCFGEYDVVIVFKLPDNTGAAALAMAAAASGVCKAVKTTPLLSVDEGVAAMYQAAAPTKSTVSQGPASGPTSNFLPSEHDQGVVAMLTAHPTKPSGPGKPGTPEDPCATLTGAAQKICYKALYGIETLAKG